MRPEDKTIWVGLLIIKDKKVLMVREEDKDFFSFPGGRLEEGETKEQALVREMQECLGIKLLHYEVYAEYDLPAKKEGITMNFTLYTGEFEDEVKPHGQVKEIKRLDSRYAEIGLEVGNLAAMRILPELREKGLIS